MKTSATEFKFFEHKDKINISGIDGAYIDFFAVMNDEPAYSRTYFLLMDKYLIGVSFALMPAEDKTDEEMLKRFMASKPFYEKVAATFRLRD